MLDILAPIRPKGSVILFIGLEDYTRIASSDPIMWKDIMVSNDKSILSSIESFKSSLDKLSELIETNNATGLIEFFHTVKDSRDKSISGKKD